MHPARCIILRPQNVCVHFIGHFAPAIAAHGQAPAKTLHGLRAINLIFRQQPFNRAQANAVMAGRKIEYCATLRVRAVVIIQRRK